MLHFIFSQLQRDELLIIRNEFKKILEARNIDIEPIKLMDGTYCLPVSIVEDEKYFDLLKIIRERGLFQNLIKREILESDKIIIEI